MRSAIRRLLLIGTHVLAIGVGFVLGIYSLPILIAPESPGVEVVRTAADIAQFKGMFRRDLADSDAFHWGEGTLYIGPDNVVFEGRLAPGPDYRLYLSPKMVETEAEFDLLKSEMVQVGLVQTFELLCFSGGTWLKTDTSTHQEKPSGTWLTTRPRWDR